MSLKLRPAPEVPAYTDEVARAVFPKGHPYLLLRDEPGVLFTDEYQ